MDGLVLAFFVKVMNGDGIFLVLGVDQERFGK